MKVQPKGEPETVTTEQEPVIQPAMHHVFLKTTRYPEMRDWYATTVGMEPTFEFPDGGGAFVTNDAANHRLVLFSHPGFTEDPQKLSRAGIHHIAFEYQSLADLLTSYKRLKPLGIEPHACLNHGPCTSFYYVDPDGNSVELQADNFGDWSRSKAFMSTPEFLKEPIGIQVDPDRMLKAFEDGDSAENLNRRSYAGEFEPESELDLRLPV
jgi:catechol 2,3-dioxygenase